MNLNKPGVLTEKEYAVFKQHPEFGRDILEPITFLEPIVPGVHFHHERWDGLGYPLGLRAQEIPLIARIISVADVYDAMTSDRAYRKALPHAATVAEVRRCAGSQFDPELVVPDWQLSLATGAVAPWRGATAAAERKHKAALAKFMTAAGFRWNTPLAKLEPEVRRRLLEGAGRRFLGILTLLEKEFVTTTSEANQKRLATFRNRVVCAECGGARSRATPPRTPLGRTVPSSGTSAAGCRRRCRG